MPRLEVLLLGSPVVRLNGRLLTNFESDKGQALLFYLAVESAQPVRRETLAGLLWPERPERLARRSLSQALYNLRQITSDYEADPPLFLTNQTTIQLNFEADIHIDTDSFDNHLVHENKAEDWQQWEGILSLFRGDFLSGFSLPTALPFEEWLSWRREHYHRLAFTAHQRLVHQYELAGQWQPAIEHARTAINLEPWQEESHQTLMRLLAVSGQRHEALAQYEICCQMLKTELDVEPLPETTALYEAIRSGEFNESGKRTTPVLEAVAYRQHETIRTNISEPTISFVGRERELQELQQLLATPPIRLITIVGAGGMGKTQLALACARFYTRDQNASAAMFKDGVFFVNLAPLSEVDGIIPTLARSISFQLQGSDSRPVKQQVLDYLHQKKILIILDNFEHLLAGVDIVNDILQAVPGVKLIATSRERLQMQAEQIFPIHGLKIPHEADFEDLETFPAVQLFLQFARRHQPDFVVETAEDYHDLYRICVLTEGMPLALELAAAWIDTFSLTEIVKEIENSLDFLEAERRDVPERHHSIRAAFQASWENLTEQEQMVFAQLSVFRGGFGREAAQAVTACSLPVLAKLTQKSFLSLQRNPFRYQIHELLRQLGAESLALNETLQTAVQRNHANYFCTFLHERTNDWHSNVQLEALEAVAQEINNVELACQYTLQVGEWHWLLQAMDSLMQFYEWNGRFEDARNFCEEINREMELLSEQELHISPDLILLWSKVLAWFGKLAGNQADALTYLNHSKLLLEKPELVDLDRRAEMSFLLLTRAEWLETKIQARALDDYQQSYHLYQELGNQWGVAQNLEKLATMAYYKGQFDLAIERAEKALTIQKELGDLRAQSSSVNVLGLIYKARGHMDEAESLHRLSLQLSEQVGDHSAINIKRAILTDTLLWQAKYDEAETLAWVGLLAAQATGHLVYESYAHCVLGAALVDKGSYELATKHADIGLELVTRFGNWLSKPFAHMLLGELALVKENYTQAQTEFTQGIAYFQEYRKSQTGTLQAMLSYAECHLKQYAKARQNLEQVIINTLAIKNYLTVVHALAGAALLFLMTGEIKYAICTWAAATCDPYVASSQWLYDAIGRYVEEATSMLSARDLDTAKERGTQMGIWGMAKNVQKELEVLDHLTG